MFRTSQAWQNSENTAQRSTKEPEQTVSHPFSCAGETFVATRSGALFIPKRGLLLVADLHLEKGSAFARRGQFLPPYDSRVTLTQLEQDIDYFKPTQVVCLGDSFHDVGGPDRLEHDVRERLVALVKRLSWIWITGNHDTMLPEALGGTVAAIYELDTNAVTLVFCHTPGEGRLNDDTMGEMIELCGHLHPVATIPSRGRSLRRKCFLVNEKRIILPAYGAYTGGLNVRDPAFTDFIDMNSRLLVIGRQTITEHPFKQALIGKR